MNNHDIVDSLIEQVVSLPSDLQSELVQSLVEMRSQQLGLDSPDPAVEL